MDETNIGDGIGEGPGRRPARLVRLERRRMSLALLLSVLAHVPLLSLTFGGDGTGLPGFNFPWQARRIEAPDLRVFLAPSRTAAAEPAIADPPQAARVEPAVSDSQAPPSIPAATRARTTAAIVVEAEPVEAAATDTAPAKPPVRVDRSEEPAPASIPEPAVIAVPRTDVATWVAPDTPAPVVAEAPVAPVPEKVSPPPRDTAEETRARIEQEARERAAEQARQDREIREAQRQAERVEAAKQEAARKAEQAEAAKQEAARKAEQAEAARQEAARKAEQVEAARQAAARQEAARQEAARAESARREAERQEATRQAVARQEAARQEGARLEAARQEAARIEAARDDARREAVRQALGRQLDEEAARREAGSPSSRLPLSVGSARRARLFGRADPNAELARYALDWERKIQLNMTFEMVREAAKQPHTNPTVTVAVRSDGSVESVTFVVSSGVAALDEAIRRVVQSQERYPAFPPALASEYDVVEIRRTWHFDVAIRLY